MPKTKVQRRNGATAQNTNGAHAANTLAALPSPPDGYVRASTDPLWWDGSKERELHGVLVDQEITASPDRKVVNAIVVVVARPVHAHNNRGELVVVQNGEAVRIDAPELQKLGMWATHPEQVLPIIVYRVDERGKTFFVADLGRDPLPRDQFKPKTPPPTTAQQGQGAQPS